MSDERITASGPRRLRGDEPLHMNGTAAGCVSDFWSWAASDLLSNTLRGRLAEFIVATAMGQTGGVRTEWDDVDVRVPLASGPLAIEVKSAAYVQSWAQERPSPISFGIAPTRGWDAPTNAVSHERRRRADVYVFCLLGSEEQNVVDPLDLANWQFFVLATRTLDALVPTQKSIRLAPLLRLKPRTCGFGTLREVILQVAS